MIMRPARRQRHRCLNISKDFPGVKALDNVSFSIWPGDVRMLLGENGAENSSLMKVLCGAYWADSGDFFCNGDRVTITKLGIAVVFQDSSLVPYLDIARSHFPRPQGGTSRRPASLAFSQLKSPLNRP